MYLPSRPSSPAETSLMSRFDHTSPAFLKCGNRETSRSSTNVGVSQIHCA